MAARRFNERGATGGNEKIRLKAKKLILLLRQNFMSYLTLHVKWFLILVVSLCLCILDLPAQEKFSKIDLIKEKIAAKELLSSGITFDEIFSEEGGIIEGGDYTASKVAFSDGILISLSEYSYKTPKIAQERFESIMQNSLKVIERIKIPSKQKRNTESETALIIRKENSSQEYSFTRVYWHKNLLKLTTSPSLKHLIAYESYSHK